MFFSVQIIQLFVICHCISVMLAITHYGIRDFGSEVFEGPVKRKYVETIGDKPVVDGRRPLGGSQTYSGTFGGYSGGLQAYGRSFGMFGNPSKLPPDEFDVLNNH